MVYYKAPNGEVYAYDPETQQTLIDEAIADGWENVTGSWPPPPSPPTADENKQIATSLLQQTDWTQIPSVSDPALSNPYLSNKLAFDEYRNSVRQYAVYPEAGDITWPTVPTENWVRV